MFYGAPVSGREALNVGLSRFEAIPAESGVRLEWDVETELGTAGYTIKRGENDVFDYLPDPGGNGRLFVIAEGGPALAYQYTFLDDTAVYNETYTYQLIEITASSSETVQDEITITYFIVPTSTPITFSGDLNTPGGGGSQNPTATPAATQPATAVSQAPTSPTNPPPPTVNAPTPLPSATPVPAEVPVEPPASDTNPPVSNEPIPLEAVPIDDAPPESAPALAAAPAAAEIVDVSAENTSAPVEQAVSDPGVASALEIAAGQETVVQPADNAPVVIGETGSAAAGETRAISTQEQVSNQEPAQGKSSTLLLWLAFAAALAIFSVSVVGAIYLYSRNRPMK